MLLALENWGIDTKDIVKQIMNHTKDEPLGKYVDAYLRYTDEELYQGMPKHISEWLVHNMYQL